MRIVALLGLNLLVANSVYADLGTIPNKTGWSGFLLGGVKIINYESNFYSGDDDNRRLNRLDSPSSSFTIAPLINADIRYTFADTRTQVFLGNLIQDAIRFDFTQQLGVRQEIGDKGTVAGSVVFNLMPIEQWSDPFAVNVDRQSTDIRSKGVRVDWDKIWGSNFSSSLTTRNIKVDEERSGSQYGADKATKLDRSGKIHAIDLSYKWQIFPDQVLEPAFVHRQADLGGSAQSYKSYGLQLTTSKRGSQWSFVSNVYLGQTKYDDANPIFGQSADSAELALTGTFFWHRLFGIAPLSATFTAGYAKSNSSISFYDSEAALFNTGMLYNF